MQDQQRMGDPYAKTSPTPDQHVFWGAAAGSGVCGAAAALLGKLAAGDMQQLHTVTNLIITSFFNGRPPSIALEQPQTTSPSSSPHFQDSVVHVLIRVALLGMSSAASAGVWVYLSRALAVAPSTVEPIAIRSVHLVSLCMHVLQVSVAMWIALFIPSTYHNCAGPLATNIVHTSTFAHVFAAIHATVHLCAHKHTCTLIHHSHPQLSLSLSLSLAFCACDGSHWTARQSISSCLGSSERFSFKRRRRQCGGLASW